jgi:hypothetical protein
MRLPQTLKIIALGLLVFMLAELPAGAAKAQSSAILSPGLTNGKLTELAHSHVRLIGEWSIKA